MAFVPAKVSQGRSACHLATAPILALLNEAKSIKQTLDLFLLPPVSFSKHLRRYQVGARCIVYNFFPATHIAVHPSSSTYLEIMPPLLHQEITIDTQIFG